MTSEQFNPTAQQSTVIDHIGSAFVEACPGAGKTRVMVERARRLLGSEGRTQGIAFLSFTNAAIDELKARLRREGIISPTPFPHYLGTFDSFLWTFFVAPFGSPHCSTAPRLMPDIDQIRVGLYPGAQRTLPLSSFDRTSGNIRANARDLSGIDPSGPDAAKYEAAARRMRENLHGQGFLDHEEVRSIALARIRDPAMASRLAPALSARFGEVIVDEAQDCNPADLEVIRWLRTSGISAMIICDPHQSIYGFRGGVTDELFSFRDAEFGAEAHLPMTGNFRSNPAICKGIVALRHRDHRNQWDQPLGPNRDDATPIQILSYRGSPTSAVGDEFEKLLHVYGIDASSSPVLATTRDCGGNAVGQPASNESRHMSLRLACAVTDFHFAGEPGERIAAIEELHRIILTMEGRLDGTTYRKFVSEARIMPDHWRPRMISLMEMLRYDATKFATSEAWLTRARTELSVHATGSRTINRLLPSHADLRKVLAKPPESKLTARTIHSVKGMEFPAVCVVLSTQIAKGVVDHLIEGNRTGEEQENARKIYVAASRAQRLLVFAAPHTQAPRLREHLTSTGAAVCYGEIDAPS